ncbi:hypothetical protein DL767_001462 [Monosporascus sp. MG133]|nr:hypothetical protein DL767_001462 [Monosporascus sp. MG133]
MSWGWSTCTVASKIPLVTPDIKVTDLPTLEDVTAYGISEEAQQNLWEKEVSRLVEVATTDTPLEFTGSTDFALDTRASYEKLAALADQVRQAMGIVLQDGENVLEEHTDYCDVETLKASRMMLDYLCNKEEDTEDLGKEVPRANPQDFFNLADYCTAVLNGLRERQDDNNMAPNICSLFGSSLRMLEGLMAMNGGKLEELEIVSKKASMRSLYFLQCAKFRAGILPLLRTLILSLRGNNKLARTSVTSYEICAMVYETGYERFGTLVYQDNGNDFLGTSDATNINSARSSFHMLDQSVRHVRSQIRDASARNVNGRNSLGTAYAAEASTNQGRSNCSEQESVGTQISWSYSPNGSDDSLNGPVLLNSMDHVITAMIPLIMTSPIAIHHIEKFIDLATFGDVPSERQLNPIKPRSYDRYTAFFCLTTEEHGTVQQSRGPDDAKSLSYALMRRKNLYAGKDITGIGRAMSFAHGSTELSHTLFENDKTTLKRIQQHQLELDEVSNKMKAWVFEEKGVMVKCKIYVCTLIFFCALLVVGGLAVGVTVGELISGVDPFNITTYCWVLAAFLLLVSKSVRVQNWPWNDFLHGRVLCKSVSELSSVTNIGEQFILVKLLQDESISFLQTRGPYNTIFRRKSEDGFSIDIPLSTWTMLLSGLIMIEVESVRGRGLVCLDLRRGTKYGVIQNLGDPDGQERQNLGYC